MTNLPPDKPPQHAEVSEDGREHWHRPGVRELMMALVEFDPHPVDFRQSNERFAEAVRETAQYSDLVLSVVAAQLHQRRHRGKQKYRPRLQQLREMCRAAAPLAGQFDSELAAIFPSVAGGTNPTIGKQSS